MKKRLKITIGVLVAVIWALIIALIFQGKEVRHYKEAFDVLKSTQKQVVLQMDESCFTQFTNNYDKTLYMKLRFGQ